jgi:hypothetical protein
MEQFPADTYFIGDPCYVIDDHSWSALCDTFPSCGAFEFKGAKCFIGYTQHGDDTYFDTFGGTVEYGVDSGSLGIVPIGVITEDADMPMRALGRIVKFDEPFYVTVENFVFNFGGVVEIDTNWETE